VERLRALGTERWQCDREGRAVSIAVINQLASMLADDHLACESRGAAMVALGCGLPTKVLS